MNNTTQQEKISRLQIGKRTSVVGIIVNIFLFVIKIIISISVRSVALAADAVNNLSDAASSTVSLVGFNVSAKPADDEHPFGHGRMEDISALIVAVIVTAIGIDFGKTAIEKIIAPQLVRMSLLQTGLVGITIFFKLGLFFYFRYAGKKIDSLSLQGAAFDSLSDIVGTTLVLVSVGAGYLWGLKLDGYAGLLMALIICKGGISLVKETAAPLIGGCPDHTIVDKMKQILMRNPKIHGVHDIIIHNYGHDCYFATAHAELSDDLGSIEAHDILEQAEIELARELPITLVLHCDPFDTNNPEVKQWRVRLENILASKDDLFKLYDFKMEKIDDVLHFYFHLLTPRKYFNHESEISELLSNILQKENVKSELHITFINSFV